MEYLGNNTYEFDYIPITKFVEAGKYYDLSFNNFSIDIDSLKIFIDDFTFFIENLHYKIDKNGLLYIYSIREQEENKCELIINKAIVEIRFKVDKYKIKYKE